MNVKKETAKLVKHKRKFTFREFQLYSMCALPVILVFIFCYLPMGGIIIAFKDYRFNQGIFGSKWVGFDNFKFFFSTDAFARITWNTLFMNFIFITTSTIAAVVLAVMLFELRSRLATKVFQTIYITPFFMSYVIVAYMVYAFLNPRYGMVNQWLMKIGGDAVDWYSSPQYWPVILMIVNIWKGIGMSSIYYYATLMGIDSSLFEAAKIDGAGKLKQTWYITFPSLVPIIMLFTITAIGNIFRGDFGMFYQVTRNVSALYPTTDIIDTYVFRALREIGDMGMGSAVGLMQSAVGLVLVIITNTVVKKIDDGLALF